MNPVVTSDVVKNEEFKASSGESTFFLSSEEVKWVKESRTPATTHVRHGTDIGDVRAYTSVKMRSRNNCALIRIVPGK